MTDWDNGPARRQGRAASRFQTPLIPARLVQRYKRFLADVTLGDGRTVTAHCPNPGSMLGLATPGARVWLAPTTTKLPFRLELVEADGTLVGINTQRPNGLVADALAEDRLPALAGYRSRRREVPYGQNSRIDLLLDDGPGPPVFVEVKNVHLRRPERGDGRAAEFPDCVTKRGAKHLAELARMVAQGARAAVVYVVQRADCDHFRVAVDLDPVYAAEFDRVRHLGVEAYCHACRVTPEAVVLDRSLPLATPSSDV